METNEPTLSTGAAEHGGAVVYVDHSAGPDRTGVTVMPPRHAKTQTMAVLASVMAMSTPTAATGMATVSAARRASPIRATQHGTAAALKAEAPQVRGVRQLEGVCPGEPFCSCGAGVIALPRDPQRAARKVRMTAKRRRGW